MKIKKLFEKIRYFFDCALSRGPIALILLLFAIVMVVVLIIGIIAFLIGGEGNIIQQIWISLMHTLDTGMIADDSTESIPYIILMGVATLCGLFVTSVLIGIITTGFEEKLEGLKKGTSIVQAKEHTTIVGFNSNIYTLLSEIIEANKNRKHACIVVLGEQDKQEMEHEISTHIKKTFNTKIVCRSGALFNSHSLELCAIENSRSIIVNTMNDSETIKVLLGITSYLKQHAPINKSLNFVASIQKEENVEAAHIASDGLANIVFAKDAISRVIANTCRQHGLSYVLTELFNFDGEEMYVEKVPEVTGKTFRETLFCFENATPVGIVTNGNSILNPDMDTVFGENDKIIVIEEDDGVYKLAQAVNIDRDAIETKIVKREPTISDLVVLGSNDKLPIIISEYDKYVGKGTRITIIDNNSEVDESYLPKLENCIVEVHQRPINKELLVDITKGDSLKNILLLNDDSKPSEEADADTLLRLTLLRDIANKGGKELNITTEMHHVENKELATNAKVNDFVIGSNYSCLLQAQISENKEIAPIIDDLLNVEGSELYVRNAEEYVKLGETVNMYTVTESAAMRGEIFAGYCLDKQIAVMNPGKNQQIAFTENDKIVVIATK